MQNKNCEVCNKEIGNHKCSTFVITNIFDDDYKAKLFCLECQLSYYCQLFGWNQEDIENYLDWELKSIWEK